MYFFYSGSSSWLFVLHWHYKAVFYIYFWGKEVGILVMGNVKGHFKDFNV